MKITQRSPSGSPRNGLRILVADDSALSRKIVEYALTDAGYDVVFAKDGHEALRIFADHAPDILITDWVMADCSGPDLCRKIRNEFKESYTYLVLLTSNTDSQSVAEGLAAGADDYLKKPFDRDELQARIGVGRRVIEMHRTIEANGRTLLLASRTDPLTGLPNRRALEEWGTKLLAGAMRHGYPVWVVLADLDSHKEVADRFGRAASDTALLAFAGVLKKNTRLSDVCVHLGGDQFVLVVTHVEKDALLVFLARLRERLGATPLGFDGTRISLTATFGIAGTEGHKAADLLTLMREAEGALVAAREAGCRE